MNENLFMFTVYPADQRYRAIVGPTHGSAGYIAALADRRVTTRLRRRAIATGQQCRAWGGVAIFCACAFVFAPLLWIEVAYVVRIWYFGVILLF